MSSKTQKGADAKIELELEPRLFKPLFYISLLVLTLISSLYLAAINQDALTLTVIQPALNKNKCLRLKDDNGPCVLFMEVADTDKLRIKGLSERTSLDPDRGMLFTDTVSGTQCFWMQGMRFALDLVWLDFEKRIIQIDKNVDPDTYPEQFCTENVRYVIELNAGYSNKKGLNLGQKLIF